MDASVIVSFISFLGMVVIWALNRKAVKADRRESKNDEVDQRLTALENNQQGMEKSINELALVQKMTVDGVSYIVDGLETKKILNGTGKKYLKDINNYYKKKGFEALQFHSLEAPKPSVRKKAE